MKKKKTSDWRTVGYIFELDEGVRKDAIRKGPVLQTR